MRDGFVMIDRAVLEDEYINQKPFCRRGFVSYLYEIAIYKPQYRDFNGTDIWLEKGDVGISTRSLSSETGWDKGKVSRMLNKLEKRGIITYKSKAPVTVVNITYLAGLTDNEKSKRDSNEAASDTATIQQGGSDETVTQTQPNKVRKKEGKKVKESKEVLDQEPCEVAIATTPLKSSMKFVHEVFYYWQDVMNKQRALLDGKRSRAIQARLTDGYTVEDLKLAIDGCARTPHNQGVNNQNKPYNDIELICRNGPNVERFMSNYESPPRIGDSKSALESEAEAIQTGRFIAESMGYDMEKYDAENPRREKITPDNVWSNLEVDRGIDEPQDK